MSKKASKAKADMYFSAAGDYRGAAANGHSYAIEYARRATDGAWFTRERIPPDRFGPWLACEDPTINGKIETRNTVRGTLKFQQWHADEATKLRLPGFWWTRHPTGRTGEPCARCGCDIYDDDDGGEVCANCGLDRGAPRPRD